MEKVKHASMCADLYIVEYREYGEDNQRGKKGKKRKWGEGMKLLAVPNHKN